MTLSRNVQSGINKGLVMVKHTEIRENVGKLADKVVLDCHNVIDLPGVYHI